MADTRTLSDYNRLNVNLNESQVDTVVPEHFKEQYPDLITFLKKYYEFMDDEGGIAHDLKNMFNARDAESTSDDLLNKLFEERSPGFSSDQFPSPRYAYKQLPVFYKTKGTNVSIDGYFRYFFQQDVEKVLPRNQTFIVGESRIGAESLKYIQDSYFYQIYSIQLKSSIPSTQWFDYYKTYLHPAGYALFAQTTFEPVVSLGATALTEIITDSDLLANSAAIISSDDQVTEFGLTSITTIDSDALRRFNVSSGFGIYQTAAEDSDVLNRTEYTGQYISIADILDPDSRRFSDSDNTDDIEYNMSDSSDITLDEDSGTLDTIGSIPGIRFSSGTETMDEAIFPFYNDSGLDSAIGPYV